MYCEKIRRGGRLAERDVATAPNSIVKTLLITKNEQKSTQKGAQKCSNKGCELCAH